MPIRRVGVVVPTADARGTLVRACVDAAHAAARGLDVAVEVVESKGPDFRFSRSINRGMAATRDADAWLLLNDDCVLDEGCLAALAGAADADPAVGLVGAVLRYPDGGIQHAGGYIPVTPAEFLVAGARHRAPFWAVRRIRENRWQPAHYMYAHWRSVRPWHRLDFLTAACVLVTRACFEKVGPYDEEYTFGCEDVDYSLRAKEHGFKLAMAAGATAVHHEGRTIGRGNQRPDSIATFERKWGPLRVKMLRGVPDVYFGARPRAVGGGA